MYSEHILRICGKHLQVVSASTCRLAQPPFTIFHENGASVVCFAITIKVWTKCADCDLQILNYYLVIIFATGVIILFCRLIWFQRTLKKFYEKTCVIFNTQ